MSSHPEYRPPITKELEAEPAPTLDLLRWVVEETAAADSSEKGNSAWDLIRKLALEHQAVAEIDEAACRQIVGVLLRERWRKANVPPTVLHKASEEIGSLLFHDEFQRERLQHIWTEAQEPQA